MEDFRKAAVEQVVVNQTVSNMENIGNVKDIDNMKESSQISIGQATLYKLLHLSFQVGRPDEVEHSSIRPQSTSTPSLRNRLSLFFHDDGVLRCRHLEPSCSSENYPAQWTGKARSSVESNPKA